MSASPVADHVVLWDPERERGLMMLYGDDGALAREEIVGQGEYELLAAMLGDRGSVHYDAEQRLLWTVVEGAPCR